MSSIRWVIALFFINIAFTIAPDSDAKAILAVMMIKIITQMEMDDAHLGR